MTKAKTTTVKKAKGPTSTLRLTVKLYSLEDGTSDFRLSRRFCGKSMPWATTYRMAAAVSIMVGDLYREMAANDPSASIQHLKED